MYYLPAARLRSRARRRGQRFHAQRHADVIPAELGVNRLQLRYGLAKRRNQCLTQLGPALNERDGESIQAEEVDDDRDVASALSMSSCALSEMAISRTTGTSIA